MPNRLKHILTPPPSARAHILTPPPSPMGGAGGGNQRRGIIKPTITAITLALVLSACTQQPAKVRRETVVFGTRVVVTVPAKNGEEKEKAAKAISEVFAHFRVMHKRFHPWREGETARINRAVAGGALPVTVSAPMAKMLKLAADHEKRSGGLFNPAIGGLVSLWGFHTDTPRQKRPPPTKKAIKKWLANPPSLANLQLTDYPPPTPPIKDGGGVYTSEKETSPSPSPINKLTPPPSLMGGVGGGKILIAAHPNMQLDFGGIAKGAALDAAADILRAREITNALVDIGGNILALGENNGRPWRAGISKGGGEVFAKINLRSGEAIATSGGGERFFVYEGRKYHHILHPKTGMPAKNASLAVVVSNDSKNPGALSDSCATALVVANKKETKTILQNCDILLALRISPDGTMWNTPPMQKRIRHSGESRNPY